MGLNIKTDSAVKIRMTPVKFRFQGAAGPLLSTTQFNENT